LAHFSVKKYLISLSIRNERAKDYNIQEVDTNVLIAKSCLAYLLHFDKSNSLTTWFVLEFLLANYVAKYWTRHAQVAKRGSTSTPLLSIELLLIKGHGLLNWIRFYDQEQPWRGSNMSRKLDDIHPSLYYASFARLIRSIKFILDKEANVNA
jgi:hypothetical protein